MIISALVALSNGTANSFFISPSDPVRGQREQRATLDALIGSPGALDEIARSFYQKTRELMVAQSWSVVGKPVRSVDVVRDVLKFVPLYWASEVVSGVCFAIRQHAYLIVRTGWD